MTIRKQAQVLKVGVGIYFAAIFAIIFVDSLLKLWFH